MKKILFFLLCSLFFGACNQVEYNLFQHTLTKAISPKESRVGEFCLTYPGYDKELVQLDKDLFMYKVRELDLYIYDGDIIFTSKEVDSLILQRRQTKACVVKNGFKHWPYGKVNYSFDAAAGDVFKSRVLAAINDISNNCAIQFIEVPNNSQEDRIVFVHATSAVGNNSPLGWQGGAQIVNIYNDNLHGVILHEIMHSLGFYHEHCRLDRDDYISINWENIKLPKYSQFNKNASNVAYDIGPIDYNSVMMYASTISDTNFVYDPSEPVMYKNDNPLEDFGGQRISLSEGDIRGLQALFGPPYAKVIRTGRSLYHNDYYDNEGHHIINRDSVQVSLRFYAEIYSATQTNIVDPRTVILKETYVTLGSDGLLHRNTYTKTINAAPGSTSIPVRTFISRKSKLGNQWIDYYDIEYEFLR